MNNFILSYNPSSMFPGEQLLANHIRFNRLVDHWFQPYLGTYLIKSVQHVGVLNSSFEGFFQSERYMLVQIWAHQSTGSLPPEIWNWLITDEYVRIPAPVAPPPPHGGGPTPPTPPNNILSTIGGIGDVAKRKSQF